MKFKSQVFTQVSGSIGGLTYSHNRGGLYTRARAIPVNPQTAAQVTVRAIFSQLITAWSTILTDTQRNDWKVYAENTPVLDALGDPLILTGQQMYLRNNSIRLRGGLPRVDDGPPGAGGITLTPATLIVSVTVFSLLFTNTDAWANEDDGGLIIQNSRQLSPTINFFAAPYRFAAIVLGDGTTPPTTPAVFTPAFGNPGATDFKTFFRLTAVSADGRISAAQIGSTIHL